MSLSTRRSSRAEAAPCTDVAARTEPRPSPLPLTPPTSEWDRVRFSAVTPRRPSPPHPQELPDGERWARGILVAAIEALTGSRPPQQLNRWLAHGIYDTLTRRAGLAVRIKGRPAVRRHARIVSMRTCVPQDGALEAVALVHDGSRLRAAAIRLEAYSGRWRATALEIG